MTRIGFLDEQFGLGCSEDDDCVLRALQAGFKAVIAREAFVHHYGGRTFVGSNIPYISSGGGPALLLTPSSLAPSQVAAYWKCLA